MSLPYPDPSNPALPSPLFSDLSAVRGDHLRANNAAIFGNLAALDTRNPAIVALTGGSFKTAALANANTYDGRSTFSCGAGVSDMPYAGVWRVLGFWNSADSSGRFLAMLDSSLETWEINYASAAWGAWTKRVDSYGNQFANTFVDGFNSTVTAAGTLTLTAASAPKQFLTGSANHTVTLPVASTLQAGWSFFITNLSTGTITVNSSGGNLVTSVSPLTTRQIVCILASGTDAASWHVSSDNPRALFTAQQPNGFWGDVIWTDSTHVTIRPKAAIGQAAWCGCVLSNGTYVERTTDFSMYLATPGSGGHILDGITAALDNEWYIIWGFEDATGTLAFGFTWMPRTTFSTNNPTNTLALNRVNAQDIGLLFNPGANLLVWNASTKFETWLYNTTDEHTPTGACNVLSRVAATLTLDGNLSVANFSANDCVVQLDNFMPLAVDDGLVVDVIGARGYRDTGIRVRTGAAGALVQFSVVGGKFFWGNYDGATDQPADNGYDYTLTTVGSRLVYYYTYIPVDKHGIYRIYGGNVGVLSSQYWETYMMYLMNNAALHSVVTDQLLDRHGLHALKGASVVAGVSSMGYVI